jgi:hypothetical protein
MVDVKARNNALELLHSFSAGRLAFDNLDAEWPSGSADPAMDAILEVLAKLYLDDFAGSTKLEPSTLPPNQRQLLKRCEDFLMTDYEYQWPGSPASRSFLATLQAVFTMGVVRSREEKEYQAFVKNGDIAAWPFLTASNGFRTGADASSVN